MPEANILLENTYISIQKKRIKVFLKNYFLEFKIYFARTDFYLIGSYIYSICFLKN